MTDNDKTTEKEFEGWPLSLCHPICSKDVAIILAAFKGNIKKRTKYITQQRQSYEQRIKDLDKWVSDLQSGMYVNCVYCGHQYGQKEGTPISMADVLKIHIEKCSSHPLSKATVQIKTLTAEVEEMKKKLEKVRMDINWMLNNRKFLNPSVFEYLEAK